MARYCSDCHSAEFHDPKRNKNKALPDLPALLMGGKALGLKQGQHLAFAPLEETKTESEDLNEFIAKRQVPRQTPLANVFVSVVNALGVPTEQFADSTGPLEGLM